MKVALTGGIACGKSLVARYLREAGLETLDADDIVHELVPEAERRRLAAEVFRNPQARKALEARLHPLVKSRIALELRRPRAELPLVVVIPLLFEVHWEKEFDIICCVTSEKETQVERMMATRGYTRDEAEARMRAQLPVEEKAAKSHYLIRNDGSRENLKAQVGAFAEWLKRKTKEEGK